MLKRRDILLAGPAALAATTAFSATPPAAAPAAGISTEFKSDATVPRPSPEYAVKMLDGSQVLISSYRGKVLAVEFLLTSCSHCQRCARTMQAMYTEFNKRGFEVLGIAVNIEGGAAEREIPRFKREQGVTWPVGMIINRDGLNEYLQRSYMDRMLAMPQLVLIDRKGVIQAQFSGDSPIFQEPQEPHFQTLITKLLKAPAGATTPTATRKTK